MPHQEGECSDDEGHAVSDGGDGLSCDAESHPQVKKVLRLLTLVSTRWDSMYYLINRALVLKNPLIKSTKSMQSTFLGEALPPTERPTDGSADDPLQHPSCHLTPINP